MSCRPIGVTPVGAEQKDIARLRSGYLSADGWLQGWQQFCEVTGVPAGTLRHAIHTRLPA
jgi:hypothetical protein